MSSLKSIGLTSRLLTVLVTALALAACGGGNNGNPDASMMDVRPGDAMEGGTDVRDAPPMDVPADRTSDTPIVTDGSDAPTDTIVTDVPPDGLVCPAGRTNCGGTCVDTTTDSMNCGACGTACTAGMSCVASACVAGCTAPNMMCGSACVNTQTDNNNCGSCGTACPMGQVCMAGMCRASCVAPLMMCGAACVDTSNDNANCGSCGHACPTGQVCNMGACSTTCAAPMTMCGATCTNTQTDNNNCGTCGTVCPGMQTCVAGACTLACTGGLSVCGAGGSMACVNLQTDNANCGTCGTMCPAGQTCTSGMCTLTCPAGQITCGMGGSAHCVNPTTDAMNCGGCGNVCPGGQMCVGGACVLTCAAGQTACGAGAAMTCVNTQTDRNNCGTCGTVCPGSQTCVAGACTLMCGATQTACGMGAAMMCVNTQTDANNCGSCGHMCGTGNVCVGGACVPFCMAPNMVCGTTCAMVLSDPANCGSCGHACPAGQLCNSGTCSLTCMAPNSVCGSGAGMTCVNLQTDNNNCGTCGTVCTAGHACTTGVCRPTNDECATAQVITMPAPGTVTTVTGNTSGATTSSGTCANQTNDIFFSFTLAAPSIVYADAFGSTYDTFLSFRDGCGSAPTACNDDSGCAGMNLQSQTAAVLGAGTHFIELGGFTGATGAFTLHLQVQPAANGVNTRIMPSGTMQAQTGTTAGTGRVAGGCAGAGPEDAYYFFSCPADPMHTFHASTCGGATWDTVLYERTAGRMPAEVCNDDEGCTCGVRSSITSTIPAGAGFHVVYVDGFTAAALGAYTMNFIEDTCDAGFSNCGGTCLQTTCLQTDNANCGACGNVCAGNATCTAGACVPNNQTCATATPVTLLASGMTTTVNASNRNAGSPGNACGGANIFYSFTLAATELVYVDTFGSTFDTEVGFQVPGCAAPATCNDDSGCGTMNLQSHLVQQLGAGTHLIVLGGFGGATGNITLHIQHMPITGTLGNVVPTAAGAYTVTGNNTGAALSTLTCGGGAAPGVYHTWMTCPGAAAGMLTATTCPPNATFDTVLQYRDAMGGTTTCNDDSCGLQSNITAMVPAGAGLHVIEMKGFGVGNVGAYTITGMHP